jgi:hypothetical protein
MKSRYKHVDVSEAFRQLLVELFTMAQIESKKIFFHVLSGKIAQLISRDSESPRSVLVRRYNEFTIGYTTQIPCGDQGFDQHVEVVQDQNGVVHLRENGLLLTPRELAVKLVALIATPDDTAVPRV